MKYIALAIFMLSTAACTGPTAVSERSPEQLNAQGMRYFNGTAAGAGSTRESKTNSPTSPASPARGKTKPNFYQAERYFKQAAQRGSMSAHSNLGYLYELGKLGQPDYSRAKYHYEQAAARGHVLATRKLGQVYLFGKGVERNVPKAVTHFENAAKAGDSTAQKYLAWLLQRQQSPRAIQASVDWWQAAAKQGSLDAQYELGKLLASMKINTESKVWLGVAAQRQHIGAQRELGRVLLREKSPKWLGHSWAAAKQGDVEAMNDLAHAYYRGKGAKLSYAKARHWAEIGANFGSAKAMNLLGVSYARGHGAKQDPKRACYWFSRAAGLKLKEAAANFARCG